MTSKKQLKARIRTRMARTGERYLTARRHVLGAADPAQPISDGGWLLRGGVHPDSAALANVLAHHGVTAGGAPLTEAMVFGVGGGLGAGYILWEFAERDSRDLVLAFRNQWQYQDRFVLTALERLGVPARIERTGGSRRAAATLAEVVDAGRPALVWPDRYLVGYWHLPPHLDGHGGHPVVVYGGDERGYCVDDLNLAPLTVPREAMDVARARVGTYRNLLVVPEPADTEIGEATLHAGVEAGIAACAGQLGATSTSFSLPAWAKWARLLTDRRNAKGWPKVFADGRGLAGALLSVWESIEPAGMAGGNLRQLYAGFLDEAAGLLDRPGLRAAANGYRAAAEQWHQLADLALPEPLFDQLRELTAAVRESVTADGDTGRAEAADAARQLWKLRTELDRGPLPGVDQDALFAAIAAQATLVVAAERAALAALDR